MAVKLITAPTQEPITLAEAKAQCRVDITTDDALIAGLVKAARLYCEKISWRAFMRQTWELWLDSWPASSFTLPFPPLYSVTSIKYYDTADVEATLSTSIYYADTIATPGAIRLKYNQTWPSTVLRTYNAVVVRFVAGYATDEEVPQNFKQAMLLLVGHWYENREAVTLGTVSRQLELAVRTLLEIDRTFEY